MLTAGNLSKRFGAKRVFDRVDVELERGQVLVVTGPNGSGKTTLLRVLAGLAAPSSGETFSRRNLRRFQLYFNKRYQTYNRRVHIWAYFNNDHKPTRSTMRRHS